MDEYYPYEDSYPAAAFGLYTAANVLTDWRINAPHLFEQVCWPGFIRLAKALDSRVEFGAANQQIAGLAALALASKIPQLSNFISDPTKKADEILARQHEEGWFNEYGGPDSGYLSVTIDALEDYFDATGDIRARLAIDRAVAFLVSLVGPDGKLPSTLNSRNTDYCVPYGLVRAASRNRQASWLVHTLFESVTSPEHFLWSTDDRYHLHYIFASIVRCLPHLDKMLPPQAPEIKNNIWLPGCGYWIKRSTNNTWACYIAANKGGIMRIHRNGHRPVLDHGWRLYRGKKCWTNNWWRALNSVEFSGNKLIIKGKFTAVQQHQSTTLRHIILRILARIFGPKLTPVLKKIMIFRPGSNTGPSFTREFIIEENQVMLIDTVESFADATIIPSPRQNLRHVASADSFSDEELKHAMPETPPQNLEIGLSETRLWDLSPKIT